MSMPQRPEAGDHRDTPSTQRAQDGARAARVVLPALRPTAGSDDRSAA
ncbi:hypothetical protein ABC795_06850 [Blastococcus sp. HT6-30]